MALLLPFFVVAVTTQMPGLIPVTVLSSSFRISSVPSFNSYSLSVVLAGLNTTCNSNLRPTPIQAPGSGNKVILSTSTRCTMIFIVFFTASLASSPSVDSTSISTSPSSMPVTTPVFSSTVALARSLEVNFTALG